MDRKEHLQWAKERALEYARQGNGADALTSLISDLAKHEGLLGHLETAKSLGTMMLLGGHLSRPADIVNFVEGFN